MLERITKFKNALEKLKEEKPLIDKGAISKLLVAANIAEMVIYSKTKVDDYERKYFDGQSFVGRYFSDWDESQIAMDYLEISNYLKKHHY
jgi:hypothetical protein